MKKAIAGALALAALGIAGILADRAVERDRSYRSLINEGDEALRRGDTSSAIEAYSGAIVLKPDSMLPFLKRGGARRRHGRTPHDLTAALRDLRTAAALDPGATRTLEELGDVNYQLQRYDNAAENYQAYLELDDYSPIIFYKLGLAARGAGRMTRAIAALQQAIKLNPSFHEAHYLLGLCFKERELLVEARAAFQQSVSIAPAFIPAREELAELHRLRDRTRDEIDELEALAALDPANPDRRIALGLAYLRGGNRERAVTSLGRAAERFPDHSGVYSALGRVWLEAAEAEGDPTDLRKALEALEPVATQANATSETLGLYGRALLLAGRQADAEQVLRLASQRFPTDPDVLPQYASVAELLGHEDNARQALIRYSVLVDDDPQRAVHAARIGDLSLRLDDAGAAISWYRRSESLAAPSAALLARLADAQSRAGQLEDARATVKRALEKDPGHPVARTVARRLQQR